MCKNNNNKKSTRAYLDPTTKRVWGFLNCLSKERGTSVRMDLSFG